MPTYVFLCKNCEDEFSIETPWAKKSEVRCPECRGDALKEMFGRYTLNVVGHDGAAASVDPCACGTPGGG